MWVPQGGADSHLWPPATELLPNLWPRPLPDPVSSVMAESDPKGAKAKCRATLSTAFPRLEMASNGPFFKGFQGFSTVFNRFERRSMDSFKAFCDGSPQPRAQVSLLAPFLGVHLPPSRSGRGAVGPPADVARPRQRWEQNGTWRPWQTRPKGLLLIH